MKKDVPYIAIIAFLLGIVACDEKLKDDTSELNVNHEYVDLGLSVKWATTNIGAKQPEDFGRYYAWGETKDKTTYNWDTYKFFNNDTITKYKPLRNDDNVQNDIILDLNDDVAHIRWGGNWRMPTSKEFKELLDNCTWIWTTQNEIKGYKVYSKVKGFTDHYIFLPAAGMYDQEKLLASNGFCLYWSSSLGNDETIAIAMSTVTYAPKQIPHLDSIARYAGYTIRPVFP